MASLSPGALGLSLWPFAQMSDVAARFDEEAWVAAKLDLVCSGMRETPAAQYADFVFRTTFAPVNIRRVTTYPDGSAVCMTLSEEMYHKAMVALTNEDVPEFESIMLSDVMITPAGGGPPVPATEDDKRKIADSLLSDMVDWALAHLTCSEALCLVEQARLFEPDELPTASQMLTTAQVDLQELTRSAVEMGAWDRRLNGLLDQYGVLSRASDIQSRRWWEGDLSYTFEDALTFSTDDPEAVVVDDPHVMYWNAARDAAALVITPPASVFTVFTESYQATKGVDDDDDVDMEAA